MPYTTLFRSQPGDQRVRRRYTLSREDSRWGLPHQPTADHSRAPLLLAGHGNLRDGDRVAAHLARQSHRVTGVLLQSREVLVADVVHLAVADEYVFGVVLFHAGQGAVAIGHLLAAMRL